MASLSVLMGSMAAMGQHAFWLGMITFLSGLSMAAVSAMKSTPQKTMSSASSTRWASLQSCSESPR